MKQCSKCKGNYEVIFFTKNYGFKDGLYNICKKCLKQRVHVNYVKHKVHINKKSMEYFCKNRERVRLQRKEHYVKNKEKILAKCKEYRLLFSKEKRIKENCRIREWKRKNRMKLAFYAQERRCRLRTQSDGTVTVESLKLKLECQENKCRICKSWIGADYHVDHIFPIKKGGLHSISNIQMLCPTCNIRKGAKTMEEYRQFLITI